MRIKLLTILAAIVMMFAASSLQAATYTMDFTNATRDLGPSSIIDLSNQYQSFGLLFSNAYRYIDVRDPFAEDFGVSNGDLAHMSAPAQTGLMHFWHDAQTSLTIDYWTIGTNVVTFEAYDENMNLMSSSPTVGDPNGSQMFYNGPAMTYLGWHDDGGYVQIANITYDLTPEPATLSLLGLGLLGLGAVRKRFRK
ncbi:MAG: PEP-CTERM sorting domain-containing protein [Candidatus Zixiibacteriota bacterium]|nr:MAG: PEP-CTERM sorting domain-containing protein [candidate division Zixibacteria bacterium]